jgi:asparagine synthetase B (glutamine-hydrolysing)
MECNQLSFPAERHAVRPKGHASMLLPQWTAMFEMGDPGVTHLPLEVRYPFVDLRLVEYLLAIPVFPWTYKKNLSRKLMAGRLPREVLLRPKTPVPADPVTAKLRISRNELQASVMLEGPIRQFVEPEKLHKLCDITERGELRPYCLDFWLKGGA